MKERLDQLTISEFVEMIAGNTDVLLGNHEIPNPKKITEVMKELSLQYKEIADPAGMRNYISDTKNILKARSELILWSICENICAFNEYERVRDIMNSYGVRTRKMNNERIKAEVVSRKKRAENNLNKADEEADNTTRLNVDIRRDFDEQTSALMAHFKFQIDPSMMKATIYAHLVARFNREIKAQLSALKKK